MKNLHFIFRMFKRNPLLISVSLPGLAVGLCAVLLLTVYLKHELSFDKHFKTKDNVLRLYSTVTEKDNVHQYGICLRKAYTEIPQQVPEIRSAAQIYRGWNITVEVQKEKYPELNLLYSDKDFFDVFGLELLHGNMEEALHGDKKVVLNASSAFKIFERTDCIGEVISISEEPFVISGVINDLPNNTHFNFDLLASVETVHPEKWGGLELYTYYRIHENSNLETVGNKIAEANDEIMKPWAQNFDGLVKSGTELLKDIHLHSVVNFDLSPKANRTHISIIIGISFFILIIALINFINLYILHGEKRIREIATRKSIGANKKSLSQLFYLETGIIGAFAFGLAILLTILIQPYFSTLMQSKFDISDMFSLSGILIVVAVLLILILVSGAYPSYFLSKIDLVNGLKGRRLEVTRKSSLSRIAVVSQFTISIFLISSLIIVFEQVSYLKKIPLGFTSDNIIGVSNLNNQIKENASSISEDISHLAFVESVGTSTHSMGKGCSGQSIKKHGSPGNFKGINEYRIDPGFAKTMQLQLKEGRYFNNSEADKNAIILNEASVKMLGSNIKTGSLMDMHGSPLNVIAIVKDFYYLDHPGEAIAPLVLTNYWTNTRNIYIKSKSKITSDQLAQIEEVFKSYSPDYIFGHFSLTDVYANKFKSEERVISIVTTGAILAIIISFIGLLALSILNVNRRRKEIGIRKVIGSTETQVVKALLSETFILVGIAIIIALIGSFLTIQQWLEGFVNRISLNPIYFLISALIAFSIAFLAVGWQSWRAAIRNPVEALRYE